MSDLRILVAEDDQDWQDKLREILHRLADNVHIDTASTYREAYDMIDKHEYDLITVDLALDQDTLDPQKTHQEGMELLRTIRQSHYNENCGLIVLTGNGTISLTNTAQREYKVYQLVEKDDFSHLPSPFDDIARAAIREARIKRAETQSRQRWRLTITLMSQHLLRYELISPDQSVLYEDIVEDPLKSKMDDFVRRADSLNLFLLNNDVEEWRPQARSIGKDLYDLLCSEQGISKALTIAETQNKRFGNLWLQFSGPTSHLRIPFELLHNGEDYLMRSHMLTRRITKDIPSLPPATTPFYRFINDLLRNQEKLRILIVGANTDGSIPLVEYEVESLKMAIETDLKKLNIGCTVDILTGATANYVNISDVLRNGHYHILHYAGHGRYNDKLPEISGLIVHDNDSYRVLTSHELNTLVRRSSELQLIYLSCCFSARNSSQVGHGSFYGVFDALSRAGVPNILGYRWTVTDETALSLAHNFYKMLWRTLSPGEALLEARDKATMGPYGLDDETWMSPVLVMQHV